MLDLKEAAQEAWARTVCVSARPVPASRSCCALGARSRGATPPRSLNFVLAGLQGWCDVRGHGPDAARRGRITNLRTTSRWSTAWVTPSVSSTARRCAIAATTRNIHDYERRRAALCPAAADPVPVPGIDEFSELLTAKPDFIEMYSRSAASADRWACTCCLASAAPEGRGRLRGLETYRTASVCGPFGCRIARRAGRPGRLSCRTPARLPEAGTDDGAVQGGVHVSGVYRTGSAQVRRWRAAARGPSAGAVHGGHPCSTWPCRSSARKPPRKRRTTRFADTVLDVIVRRPEAQARRRTRCGCRRWTASGPRSTFAAARPHARAGPRSHPARLRGRGTPRRSCRPCRQAPYEQRRDPL